MYSNPLLIVQAMYCTSKGQSVYYSTWGGFMKIFCYRLSVTYLRVVLYIFMQPANCRSNAGYYIRCPALSFQHL